MIKWLIFLFQIKNFVSQHFCRISYILAGKWRFLWIKVEPLVKNDPKSESKYFKFVFAIISKMQSCKFFEVRICKQKQLLLKSSHRCEVKSM